MTEETIFHEALARPAAERPRFLDQACSGRPELRAAIEALLAAHERPDNLLDQPSGNLAATWDSQPPGADSADPSEHAATDLGPRDSGVPSTRTAAYRLEPATGMVIAGRYALQEKIGEGGMGEVWVAKQTEPVKRKVALKLIKTGMDSRAVLQRFEQERQALAVMDHPHIARVLDGGMTPTGQPFFVMELVNGLPLTKFCDEMKLPPKARLELFVPICQAVQHAHQKGIVHRDLKPANILVTLIDGKPVPKVIDFGVAKATSGKLTVETMSTGFGAVVGTLEYMSPEQAGFSGEDIDTRADIYSLGVILYELLTGLRPIDANGLKKAALAEMIRMIQEDEPSKPSTRLSTDESLASLAAVRQTEPKKLMALLRGELDWVVMKCLEKQRNRRYETANALARDVQRFLADEPVEARPPSAGYRLSKFVRRHRTSVAAASLLLLTLISGILATSLALVRARRAERLATTQGVRAAVVRDFLVQDLLGQASPELNPRSDQITVEQLLDRAATRLNDDSRMADAPEARAEVFAVLGETYNALGQYEKASDCWQRAIELNRHLKDRQSSARALDALDGYGSALIGAGRLAEAEKLLRDVLERRRRTLGSEHPKTLFTINNLGHVLFRQGRLAEAEPLARENLHTRVRIFGKEDKDTLQAVANYAALLMAKGDYEQAESLLREAVNEIRGQSRPDSPSSLEFENGLASSLIHRQKWEEAKTHLIDLIARKQRVLGPTHSSTMGSRANLAYVLGRLGDVEVAIEESMAVYEGLRAEYGETYSETLTAMNSLVLALCSAHRWDEAERYARLLVETEQGKDEPNQTDLITFTMNLGWASEGQQNLDEAEKWYRESLKIAQAAGHAETPTGLDAAHNLARVLFRQKRFQESLALGRRTLAARRRIQSPSLLASLQGVIETLLQLQRFDEAEQELRDLVSTVNRPWPDEVQADLCVQLGKLSLQAGHYREAMEPLQNALDIRQPRFAGQWQVCEVQSLLGEAFTGIGQFDKAEQWLLAAMKGLDAAPAAATAEAAAIRDATNRRLGQLAEARKSALDEAPPRSPDQAK